VKSRKVDSVDEKTSKSWRIKRPKTIPLKSESNTLLVYSANAIARSDGRSDRTEGSMTRTQKLKVLNPICQIFLCRVHTLFV
jgi:hypothetical protein